MTATWRAGDRVEIQRETGAPWELAIYERKLNDMRGWHRVTLAQDRPRYIDTQTWVDRDPTEVTARKSFGCSVPTRRVRTPHLSKEKPR